MQSSTSGSGGGVQQQLRGGTLAKQRAETALREANMQPGKTTMVKKEDGKFGQQIDALQSNIHRLDVDKAKKVKVFRYEFKVVGVTRRGHEVVLSQPSNSDYQIYERRFFCLGVYNMFSVQHQKMNIIGFYDVQRLFFSLKDMGFATNGQQFEYSPVQIMNAGGGYPLNGLANDFASFKLTVTPFPKDSFQLTLGDFAYLNRDLEQTDRSVEQFLDIATSQKVFENFSMTHYSASLFYFQSPRDFGFTDADCPYFPSNCSFLGIGVHKGVRPILTSDKDTTYGMVVQIKKSPFHEDDDATILKKCMAIMGNEFSRANLLQIKNAVEPRIKGIFVETNYRGERNQKFLVHGLAGTNAETMMIDHKGAHISIFQYYQQQYELTIRFPHLPLVIRKQGVRLSHYPMECCRIFDNQRIKEKQQTPAAIQEMIRRTAIAPSKVIQENEKIIPSLGLPNELTDAAGIKFDPTPIEVKARVLPPPALEFARGAIETIREDSVWKGVGQYLVPANCTKWMALAINDGRERIDQRDFREFVKRFQERANQMGMLFQDPEIHFEDNDKNLKDIFTRLAQSGYEYVLITHPDRADDVHHDMKFHEKQTEVVSQGVKHSTVRNVVQKGQRLTLANIVNKTNVKLGGLNYAPSPARIPLQEMQQLFGKEAMFIGFAANHPGLGLFGSMDEDDLFAGSDEGHSGGGIPNGNGRNGNGHNGNGHNGNGDNGNGGNGHTNGNGSANGNGNGHNGREVRSPSVIGFAANIGKVNWFEFVGGYAYQQACRDEKVDIIADTVKSCVLQFRQREGSFPKKIVVLRNGCAEGAFQSILKYEVPLMKKGLAEVECKASITLLVVNKLQQLRLFPKNINPNAKPFEQNIKPGTIVDTGIVHPNWTEFYLSSHRPLQGTAAIPRYNLLLDENNLAMDTIQLMCHFLCFGHQIVYSPTSLPSPIYIAEQYAKRGRNNFNVWAQKGDKTGINGHQDLTRHLGVENTTYLKYLRSNA